MAPSTPIRKPAVSFDTPKTGSKATGAEAQSKQNNSAPQTTDPPAKNGSSAAIDDETSRFFEDEDEYEELEPATAPGSATKTAPDGSSTSTSTSPKFMGGYNALKTFNGQTYTGMAVGGSHTWNYDAGIWKETKLEPDLWKIDFDTKKRRAKNAPKGSGAPEGMEYHWLIVAHQYVKKTDANTYETHLVGSKYKLAHKGPTATSWSVPTVKAQRERELELLDDAKRRVQGLPPVVAGEKVKVETKEKGQQRLDALFSKTPPRKAVNATSTPSPGMLKRKREEDEDGEGDKENMGMMAKFVRRNE